MRSDSALLISIHGLMAGLKTAERPLTQTPDACICLAAIKSNAMFEILICFFVYDLKINDY